MDTAILPGLVFRGLDLAAANNIDATPTLFINGYRIAGIKDADQLRKLIADAQRDARRSKASTVTTERSVVSFGIPEAIK